MLKRIFLWPGNWLVTQFSAEERRGIATWCLLFYVGTFPLRTLYKDQVWMVWLLSELAMVIGLLSIIAAETPVENEKKD